MKKYWINLLLCLALLVFSVPVFASAVTPSKAISPEEEIRLSLIAQKNIITLPELGEQASEAYLRDVFAKIPAYSCWVKSYDLKESNGSVTAELTYFDPMVSIYGDALDTFSLKLNTTEYQRIDQIMAFAEKHKINSPSDLLFVQELLSRSKISASLRSSLIKDSLHYSLVIIASEGGYNLDLKHHLVPDSVMEKEGYAFLYDPLNLNITRPVEKAVLTKAHFTYYSQIDTRWKLIRFSSSTVQRTGCGPVAAAMIVNYLTPSLGEITPPQIIQLAKASDLDIKATPRVHMPKLLNALSQKYKFKYETLKTFDERSLTSSSLRKKIASELEKAKVSNAIKEGKLVLIATLTNSELHYTDGVEHYLVVKDYVNDKALVFDPLPHHSFYEKGSLEHSNQYTGYFYEVPLSVLLKNMTQAYTFDQ